MDLPDNFVRSVKPSSEVTRLGPSRIRLTNYQYFGLVTSSYLPLTFWGYPRIVAQRAGIDSLWAILGLFFVGQLLAVIHQALNGRFPSWNGAQMMTYVFGKWIGKAILVIYMPTYCVFVAVATNTYLRATVKPFFPQTPNSALFIALLVVCTVGSVYGVETLARTIAVWLTLTIIAFIMLLLLALIQNGSLQFGGTTHIANGLNTLRGVYALCPLLFGFNSILMIQPYVQKTRLTKWIPLMCISTSFLLVFIGYLTAVMTFGIRGLQEIMYPIPMLLHTVSFTAFFNNAAPLLLTITITFNGFFLATHIWALSTLLAEIIGKGAAKYKWFIPYVVAAILAIDLLLGSEGTAIQLTEHKLTALSWLLLFAIPLFLLCAARLRFGRNKSSPQY